MTHILNRPAPTKPPFTVRPAPRLTPEQAKVAADLKRTKQAEAVARAIGRTKK